jgi:hypothetical protein
LRRRATRRDVIDPEPFQAAFDRATKLRGLAVDVAPTLAGVFFAFLACGTLAYLALVEVTKALFYRFAISHLRSPPQRLGPLNIYP